MVTWRRIVLLSMLLLLAGGALRHLLKSPKHLVIERFHRLADALGKEPEDGTSRLVLDMKSLEGLLHDPCVYNLRRYNLQRTMSPQEAVSEAVRVRQAMSRMEVTFHDFQVELAADEKTCRVRCTVRVLAKWRHGPERQDVAELDCELRKIDGKWRFAKFAEVLVLEK